MIAPAHACWFVLPSIPTNGAYLGVCKVCQAEKEHRIDDQGWSVFPAMKARRGSRKSAELRRTI